MRAGPAGRAAESVFGCGMFGQVNVGKGGQYLR